MVKTPVIMVDGLVAAYGDDVILDRVTFEIREGERFVILGGSGCGKSTLLKHLIGLVRPREGSINILGKDIAGPDEGASCGSQANRHPVSRRGAFRFYDSCREYRASHYGIHEFFKGIREHAGEDETCPGQPVRL